MHSCDFHLFLNLSLSIFHDTYDYSHRQYDEENDTHSDEQNCFVREIFSTYVIITSEALALVVIDAGTAVWKLFAWLR